MKLPRPLARRVAFWASSIGADLTLVADVAKWLCHPKVSFSTTGFCTATIRRIHHATSSVDLVGLLLAALLLLLRRGVLARGAGASNVGGGAAAAPGSESGAARSDACNQAGGPAAATASTRSPEAPKPVDAPGGPRPPAG